MKNIITRPLTKYIQALAAVCPTVVKFFDALSSTVQMHDIGN